MRRILPSLMLSAAVFLSAAAANGATGDKQTAPKSKVENKQSAQVIRRHTHRHCHTSVGLGHVKKSCHTHKHNVLVHHGPH